MAVSWLLPEAVGMPRAREMLYTGRVVAADEALAQPVTMATADIHKGIQARREHRPPTFDGS